MGGTGIDSANHPAKICIFGDLLRNNIPCSGKCISSSWNIRSEKRQSSSLRRKPYVLHAQNCCKWGKPAVTGNARPSFAFWPVGQINVLELCNSICGKNFVLQIRGQNFSFPEGSKNTTPAIVNLFDTNKRITHRGNCNLIKRTSGLFSIAGNERNGCSAAKQRCNSCNRLFRKGESVGNFSAETGGNRTG